MEGIFSEPQKYEHILSQRSFNLAKTLILEVINHFNPSAPVYVAILHLHHMGRFSFVCIAQTQGCIRC